MSDRRNRKAREPWGPDIAAVLVLFVVAGWLGLPPTGFIVLVCVVGGVVGYRQGRAERRTGRRPEAMSLHRRQRPSRSRELPMPRPAAAAPCRGGPRPRYEPDDLGDHDDWDFDDEWGRDDDWDFDDDEPRRRPGRRHGESWETGDADYI